MSSNKLLVESYSNRLNQSRTGENCLRHVQLSSLVGRHTTELRIAINGVCLRLCMVILDANSDDILL